MTCTHVAELDGLAHHLLHLLNLLVCHHLEGCAYSRLTDMPLRQGVGTLATEILLHDTKAFELFVISSGTQHGAG